MRTDALVPAKLDSPDLKVQQQGGATCCSGCSSLAAVALAMATAVMPATGHKHNGSQVAFQTDFLCARLCD